MPDNGRNALRPLFVWQVIVPGQDARMAAMQDRQNAAKEQPRLRGCCFDSGTPYCRLSRVLERVRIPVAGAKNQAGHAEGRRHNG